MNLNLLHEAFLIRIDTLKLLFQIYHVSHLRLLLAVEPNRILEKLVQI